MGVFNKEDNQARENAKATADFVDLTIRLADKYGFDRKKALEINIISLISAEQVINFNNYVPKGE